MKFKSSHHETRQPRRPYSKAEMKALGSAAIGVGVGLALLGATEIRPQGGDNKIVAPNQISVAPTTEHVMAYANPGDTVPQLQDRMVEQLEHDNPGFHITREQLKPFLHVSESANGDPIKNPNDGILQVGEGYIANVPIEK